MTTESQKAYFAGVVDMGGYFAVRWTKEGYKKYRFSLSNKQKTFIQAVKQMHGNVGHLYRHGSMWRWEVFEGRAVFDIATMVLPYLQSEYRIRQVNKVLENVRH